MACDPLTHRYILRRPVSALIPYLTCAVKSIIPVKAYYDWLAGLSEADRDRRYRERFDRIDTNHDGTMDRAERAAWRQKRSAFYHNSRTAPAQSAAAVKSEP